MAGVVTAYAFDVSTLSLLAELPLTNKTFSQRLNSAGSFSATLELGDKRVQALNPQDATRPGRTIICFDVDGAIAWAGLIKSRTYASKDHTLQIAGNEMWGYFAQRVQAGDYSVAPSGFYWNANPVGPAYVAAELVRDATNVIGSALYGLLAIRINEAYANPNLITPSYPLTSVQTIDSMVSTLSSYGYGTGFDYAIDVGWSSTSPFLMPVFTLNINYPRRGRIAGSTGLVIDTGTGNPYEWPEDASIQANQIYAIAGGSGGVQAIQSDSTPVAAGYPLLEKQTNYSAINTLTALQPAAEGDLAQYEWPVATPVFTVPMFGDPAIGNFIMGDDIRVIIPPDPRFPKGVDTYLRVTAADYHVADAGLSTMAITCGVPPALAPVPPPPI